MSQRTMKLILSRKRSTNVLQEVFELRISCNNRHREMDSAGKGRKKEAAK